MSAESGPAAGRLGPGWPVRALTRHDGAGLPDSRERSRSGTPVTASEGTSGPAWIDVVEQAVAAAAAPDALPSMGSWQEAFVVPLRPFLAGARARLIGGARRFVPPAYVDPGPMADTFTEVLGRKLAHLAVRTLVLELNVARAGNRLDGADGRQRFADFLRRQCTAPALAALFEEYPVLGRLLGTASWLAAEAGLELLMRFATDRAAVVESLLGGVDPGPVVAIEPGLGDLHRQGRSVAGVLFADGRKVIYKPRDMAAYVFFREVIRWFNQRLPLVRLRTAAVLSRSGYGWQEFIACRPLTGSGVEMFYRREGVLLAALYAMHASDIHCENLIACGDQPILIDVETLFHPAVPSPHTIGADPAAEMLAASVRRCALLPCVNVGERGVLDQSGMGGDDGGTCPDYALDWDPPAVDDMRLIRRTVPFAGALNRPCVDGGVIEPADHEAAVLDGFRLGYDAITGDRQGFTRLVKSRGDLPVRIIIRPSRAYARLLDESTHPDLLRAARDRDKAFDVLDEASARHPLWSRLVGHERADLWAGDIPFLTGRAAERDIWTSAGHRLPGLLDRPGLGCALDKIMAMGEVDRRDQEWIISASLASRRPAGDHRSTEPAPGPATAVAADPVRLLATACGLADQIVARSITARDRVNWLGLQLVENSRWIVLPMGADLGYGYLGVALFLAQLAELTGIWRYAETALRAVSPMPQLLDVLASRSDLVSAVGCGGAEGLGGISYGLARIATLLQNAEVRASAEVAVDLAAVAADRSTSSGWAAGHAGCLAAMTGVQAELGSTAAGSLARTCAERLTGLVERTDGRCVPGGDPVPPGFAVGPAGIGWALTRYAATGAEPKHALAGRRAARCASESEAGEEMSYGWCSGAAGSMLARPCLTFEAGLAALRSAVRALAHRPMLRDLSLCHGELGIADSVAVLATIYQGEGGLGALRHRAGLMLDAASRHALCCGTPGGVSTPGLLNGLAGIGYGLLRLGFTKRVPSVLLLEPNPRSSWPHAPADLDGETQPQ
jgi:type 2 lantibiotic biosynthesis protein LanM